METQAERKPLLNYENRSNSLDSPPLPADPTANEETTFKLYWSRWYMLAVLALLNFSNGIIWMSFSNIADSVSIYYQASTFQVDMLSIVFMITTLVLGIPAMWSLDKHGLRASFHIAAWTNCLGAVIRILSTLYYFERHNYSYVILLVGQTLAGCSQPFMMFASTKLVAVWFGPDERTLANTIGSLANPLGFSLGGLISALLVNDVKEVNVLNGQIATMLQVTAAPAFLGALMTLGVTSPRPPTMPSSSSSHEIEPFVRGLKMLAGSKSYLLLSLCYGAGVGIISSLVTVMNQLLLPQGYSNMFSGTCVCLFVVFGFIGSFASSLVADKTKKHEIVAKLAFAFGSIFLILFLILSHYSNLPYFLIAIVVIAGFFCLSVSPLCLELGVESSYPVAVGTSAGILVISGQIMSALFTLLLSIGSQPITAGHHGDIINNYALVVHMVLTTTTALIFLVFYRNPQKRILFETMTREILEKLPHEDQSVLRKILYESHANCVCNRLQNTEPPYVVSVTTRSDI